MADARVVDTNVLIVASAADDASVFNTEATPVDDARLRQQVLDWLLEFEGDPGRHVVLDYDWLVFSEYERKLTEQDYGLLAMLRKQERNEVLWVKLEQDRDGHAVLPSGLEKAVSDRDDRKMVAAALAASECMVSCRLTNACDTDWLDCGDAIATHGVCVEHLIEEWLRRKWQEKRRPK
jgi:hypothetical protein